MNEWQARVNHLVGSGMSVNDIAKAVGLTAQSVSDIKCDRTGEPKGMAAVKLHALAKRKGYGRQAV